jgi:CxxC motif-containing protein
VIDGVEIVCVTPTALLVRVNVKDLDVPGSICPKSPEEGEKGSWQGQTFTATVAPVAPAERTVT